jgi:glucose-1-phosphate thymidylyltransferase
MWGIVPAAGVGSRIQPLAFSKELLPVGSRRDVSGEHPKAVGEYLLERMLLAGATRICLVISPGKWDIVSYFGAKVGAADLCYVVQPKAAGLCDAVFRALPLIAPDDEVVVGLPDTVWFPEDGLAKLEGDLTFLTFPVDEPHLFDAVVTDDAGRVLEIQVKSDEATSSWVWGAFKLRGRILRDLHDLWCERDRRDPYLGTLVNAYIAKGGEARAVAAGRSYVDVGTLNGYRRAIELLGTTGEGGAR